MTRAVDLEIKISLARAWREKAMEKERQRHAAAMTKIQAQYERRMEKIGIQAVRR